MARIVSIATANPSHRIEREQAELILNRVADRWALKTSPLLRILRNTQISTRYTVRGKEELDRPMPFKESNGLYMQQCLELGERVSREAISRAGLTPSEID